MKNMFKKQSRNFNQLGEKIFKNIFEKNVGSAIYCSNSKGLYNEFVYKYE